MKKSDVGSFVQNLPFSRISVIPKNVYAAGFSFLQKVN